MRRERLRGRPTPQLCNANEHVSLRGAGRTASSGEKYPSACDVNERVASYVQQVVVPMVPPIAICALRSAQRSNAMLRFAYHDEMLLRHALAYER